MLGKILFKGLHRIIRISVGQIRAGLVHSVLFIFFCLCLARLYLCEKILCLGIVRVVFENLVENIDGAIVVSTVHGFSCVRNLFGIVSIPLCLLLVKLVEKILCLGVIRIVGKELVQNRLGLVIFSFVNQLHGLGKFVRTFGSGLLRIFSTLQLHCAVQKFLCAGIVRVLVEYAVEQGDCVVVVSTVNPSFCKVKILVCGSRSTVSTVLFLKSACLLQKSPGLRVL